MKSATNRREFLLFAPLADWRSRISQPKPASCCRQSGRWRRAGGAARHRRNAAAKSPGAASPGERSAGRLWGSANWRSCQIMPAICGRTLVGTGGTRQRTSGKGPAKSRRRPIWHESERNLRLRKLRSSRARSACRGHLHRAAEFAAPPSSRSADYVRANMSFVRNLWP